MRLGSLFAHPQAGMSALFGTDGVRGIPGEPPLTEEGVLRLGWAAGKEFLSASRGRAGSGSPAVFLGRDTRGSGPALARSLARGLAAAGCLPADLGVLPTPAVSYLAVSRGAIGGAVVSASHNPPAFNGVKFFSADGSKLSVEAEKRVEGGLARAVGGAYRFAGRSPAEDKTAASDYADFLKSTYPPTSDLEGVRIVLDCANGAACGVAGGLLRGLGATVFELGVSPNGRNINLGCGATDTARMRREVLKKRAHLGVSLDGDADRAVFSDERGTLLGGDYLLALSALSLRDRGLLARGKVVVTVMSNLGLLNFLAAEGIGAVEVPVGDRNVTDALAAEGLILGAENSGHVVFRRFAPTGDGLLTALQTLAAWRERGGRFSEVGRLYKECPQTLKNVRVEKRLPLEELKGFSSALKKTRAGLRGGGRVFVRYSGTEPLLRILVEGRSRRETVAAADGLARVFREEVNAKTASGA